MPGIAKCTQSYLPITRGSRLTVITDPQLLPEREFIGYGLNKPDPKWPNGAKIAVSFIVNYWYGSEANPELGDKTHEILHLDLPPGATGPIRNDMNEAQYEVEFAAEMLLLARTYLCIVRWTRRITSPFDFVQEVRHQSSLN